MILKRKYQLKGYVGNKFTLSIFSALEDISYDVSMSGDYFCLKYVINEFGSILVFLSSYEIINQDGEVIERYDNGVDYNGL